MFRRLLLLDAALIALLVMGGMRVRKDWKAFEPAHDIAAIQPKPHAYPAITAGGTSATTTSADWTEIPSRDPFSFDRTDVDIVIAVPVEAPPPKPLGPKPILYGTFILGNEKTALVATGAGGKGSKPMKVGDVIDGWTILNIASGSMQIESNGTRQTVITNDPTNAPPREIARTVATAPAPVGGVVQTIGNSAPPKAAPVSASPQASSGGASTSRPAADPLAGLPAAPEGMKYASTPFGPMLVTKDSK